MTLPIWRSCHNSAITCSSQSLKMWFSFGQVSSNHFYSLKHVSILNARRMWESGFRKGLIKQWLKLQWIFFAVKCQGFSAPLTMGGICLVQLETGGRLAAMHGKLRAAHPAASPLFLTGLFPTPRSPSPHWTPPRKWSELHLWQLLRKTKSRVFVAGNPH